MTGNRYNILVAEDEAIIALELKLLLLHNNFNVVGVVKSGEDLINESRKQHPDVIITDINLKGELNGIEAAKMINKKFPKTPVIFVTGYNDEYTHSKAIDAFSTNEDGWLVNCQWDFDYQEGHFAADKEYVLTREKKQDKKRTFRFCGSRNTRCNRMCSNKQWC